MKQQFKSKVFVFFLISLLNFNQFFLDFTIADGQQTVQSQLENKEKFSLIPKEFAWVNQESSSKNKEIQVVLISDAHCDAQAQTNIAKILKQLIQNHHFRYIAVEGASESLNLEQWDQYSRISKQTILDPLLKQGYVTGAEFLKVVSGSSLSFELQGLEDPYLYKENFKVLKQALKELEQWKKINSVYEKIFSQLKKIIFSKTLLEFDDKVISFSQGKEPLQNYVLYLARFLKDRIHVGPSLSLFLEMIQSENKVNLLVLKNERDELIERLQKNLKDKDLKNVIQKILEYRTDRISELDFYEFLCQYANDSQYSTLLKYRDFLDKKDHVLIHELLNEIKNLENQIYISLASTSSEKKLLHVVQQYKSLNNLFHLRMTPHEWEVYKTDFDMDWKTKLRDLIKEHSLVFPSLDSMDAQPFETFYRLAIERNQIMLKNFLKQVPSGEKAVLITGGFHTQAIADLLHQLQISYCIVQPKTDALEKNPYFSLMQGIGNINLALPPLLDPENLTTQQVGAVSLARVMCAKIKINLEFQRRLEFWGERLSFWYERMLLSLDNFKYRKPITLMMILSFVTGCHQQNLSGFYSPVTERVVHSESQYSPVRSVRSTEMISYSYPLDSIPYFLTDTRGIFDGLYRERALAILRRRMPDMERLPPSVRRIELKTNFLAVLLLLQNSTETLNTRQYDILVNKILSDARFREGSYGGDSSLLVGLQDTRNEDWFIWVLAHEIAHNIHSLTGGLEGGARSEFVAELGSHVVLSTVRAEEPGIERRPWRAQQTITERNGMGLSNPRIDREGCFQEDHLHADAQLEWIEDAFAEAGFSINWSILFRRAMNIARTSSGRRMGLRRFVRTLFENDQLRSSLVPISNSSISGQNRNRNDTFPSDFCLVPYILSREEIEHLIHPLQHPQPRVLGRQKMIETFEKAA